MSKAGTYGIDINQFSGEITVGGTISVSRPEGIKRIPEYEIYSGTDMAFGDGAMASFVSPVPDFPEGRSNIAIGNGSLSLLENTGNHNSAVGYLSGHKNNGIGNTFLGSYQGAYFAENTGSYNTHVGLQGPINSTSGDYNASLGYACFYDMTTGAGNIGIGYGPLPNVTTGSYNIGIGRLAGREVVLGDENTYIGYMSGTGMGDTTGVLFVGAGSRRDIYADDNGIVLGDGNTSTEVLRLIVSDGANLDFPDDATAASAGVPINGLYHTSGTVKIRLV